MIISNVLCVFTNKHINDDIVSSENHIQLILAIQWVIRYDTIEVFNVDSKAERGQHTSAFIFILMTFCHEFCKLDSR